MVRDGGCAFPGCLHTRFLHAHHIKHWLHGGETRLDNLVLLCSFHHHLVHEGGWTISRVDAPGGARSGAQGGAHGSARGGAYGDAGGFLFHSPDGKPLERNPAPEPVEEIPVWMRDWAEEHNLELGPDVNMPQWDGTRPDYDLAIGVLLQAAEGG